MKGCFLWLCVKPVRWRGSVSFLEGIAGDEQQDLQLFQRETETNQRGKDGSVWTALCSVSLSTSARPQPLFSVLPQTVIFQSVSRQSSSHGVCALLGLWRHPLPPPSMLFLSAHSLSPFVPASPMLPFSPWYWWEERRSCALGEGDCVYSQVAQCAAQLSFVVCTVLQLQSAQPLNENKALMLCNVMSNTETGSKIVSAWASRSDGLFFCKKTGMSNTSESDTHAGKNLFLTRREFPHQKTLPWQRQDHKIRKAVELCTFSANIKLTIK